MYTSPLRVYISLLKRIPYPVKTELNSPKTNWCSKFFGSQRFSDWIKLYHHYFHIKRLIISPVRVTKNVVSLV